MLKFCFASHPANSTTFVLMIIGRRPSAAEIGTRNWCWRYDVVTSLSPRSSSPENKDRTILIVGSDLAMVAETNGHCTLTIIVSWPRVSARLRHSRIWPLSNMISRGRHDVHDHDCPGLSVTNECWAQKRRQLRRGSTNLRGCLCVRTANGVHQLKASKRKGRSASDFDFTFRT